VYPNPNTGEFTVTAPSAKTITIYDTTGKTVRIIQLEHPHEKLFVKGLAPGLYFVHFQNKSSVIVQKVLIQK
jgi:hypothetical protein